MDKSRKLERQRQRRKETGNADVKKYERTLKGHLVRTYRNMMSRVAGIQTKKAHLYEGKEILTKDEFYSWAINNPDYIDLWAQWTAAAYTRGMTPSIDRIDSTKGYFIGNMRWLTHSQNSRLGAQRSRAA